MTDRREERLDKIRVDSWFNVGSARKTVSASGTAILNIKAGSSLISFATVRIRVSFSGNSALNGFFDYELLTCDSGGSGGGAAIRQTLNESTGSFQVATTDFAVTRQESGIITITYTNQASGANVVDFFVQGNFGELVIT